MSDQEFPHNRLEQSSEPNRDGEPQITGRDSQPQSTEPIRIEVDDSNVEALYANFCRVSSTPEEVILDLGLNPNPLGQSADKLRISQRVILNHYTAKRLAALLSATVQRHEKAFGVLETDVRKRVRI